MLINNLSVTAIAPHKDWFFLSFLVILSLSALLFQQYPKLIKYYINVTFSTKSLIFKREESQSGRAIGVGLDVLSASIHTLFFWVVWQEFEASKSYTDLASILLFAVVWILLIWGKRLLIWIIGRLFQEEKMSTVHIGQLQVNNRINALLILPLMIASYYTPYAWGVYFLYIAGFVIIVQFLIRFVKLFFNSLQLISFPYYFSILYLCTVEILPVTLFIKLAV